MHLTHGSRATGRASPYENTPRYIRGMEEGETRNEQIEADTDRGIKRGSREKQGRRKGCARWDGCYTVRGRS